MSEFDANVATAAQDYQESLWLVALFESEEPIQALLERLRALGVETHDASIVRVELNDQQRAVTRASQELSPHARNAITGAIIGSSIFTLIGITLYELALLNLRGIEGLLGHAFAFALAGAALGGVLGSVIIPVKKRRAKLPTQAANKMPAITSEGYLVALKMPPELGEQAETIARTLGAKQILC
jgi:Cu/Ag efflux pump CusA